MKDHIYQFYPEKYGWLTRTKKVEWDGMNLKTSKLIDMMNYFITKSYLFGVKEFNLWSVLLQQKYGCTYKQYLNWMLGNGIIELKSKWFAGKKASTYNLRIDLENETICRYRNSDKVLLKKWNKSNNLEEYEKKYTLSDVQKELIEDLYYVDLDYQAAFESLKREYDNGFISYSNYIRNRMSIETIQNKDIFWNFDSYGRMHTNFTVLKKAIRNNYLTINGEELTELDIKNSQPFFLAKFLAEHMQPNMELDSFIDSVKNNKFYNTIQDESMTRKEVKGFVFKVFFGKNFLDKDNQKFRKVWPTIWNWIKEYKQNNHQHAALAWQLQRMESDLIFNQVCTEIKKADQSIKLFTVHDSIFFPKNKLEIVKPIFDAAIQKTLNI